MKQWKYWLGIGVSVVAVCAILLNTIPQTASAEETIDQKKLDNISQNCSSIKQSLKDLQRADSRTRTYLGTAYETVSTAFITPLNLRLVKNNQVDTKLFEIQGDFSEQLADFRTEYTNYMRELEALIAVDCQKNTQEFYRKLEKTREHRTKLHDLVEGLNDLVSAQYKGVSALKEEL